MCVVLLTNKMDNKDVYVNRNNNEMEDEFDNSTDDKVCLYDTDNKQKSIHDYVTIKDENIYDRTVVGFIKKELCDMEYKQGNIHNYVSIKEETIDDLTVVIPETELKTDCIDNKVCLNKTAISRGYVKQELCGMKDDQSSIQNYPSIKDENIDDLTVVVQETKLVTDYIDNKVCVHATIISGGSIKEEPCDTGDESGSIHNNVDTKGCGECGDKYDLYCLKCPMLIRIFDSNDPDGTDTIARRTLPKKFIDICETQSGLGIVALRAIPKGVVFGPFKGLDSTKDDVISKWKLKNKELAVAKDAEWLNWMQYVRRADKSFHQNLVPFQYEDELYYRSEYHINMGDELLVHWDSDSKESEIQDMEYWVPEVCESLGDSYACTFCCVGYKSIVHLNSHNSTCIEKRNKKDFGKEIVQCDVCKIYLDKKEYSDYHMNLCYESNRKCVFNSRCKKNRGQPLHNDDRPFSCTLCPYKAMTNSNLKQHIATHNGDKPFACTLCPYKTKTKPCLKLHIAIHNGDKPFACTLCPYKAASKSNLRQHIAIHKNDKPFACTLCSYKTKTKSYLKKHIVIHNDDKAFACTLCPYKTMTKSNLKQHIAIHNKDKPFACTLCPYKTTRKAILKEHMSVHNDDRPFACSLCPYKATTKSKLKQHIAIHNGGKPFACTLCPYKTMTNSNLKQHTANHNGDKPFVCTLCPYKTTTNSNLKQHIVSHNGNKPFACTLCPYKTIRKSILKQHIAIHNDDKPLACTFCPYKATTKSNLKQHIAIHNGDKPFACTLCPYKATRKWILKEHIAVHNDEKPFVCTLCPYRAKTKSYLKKHIAIHDGDKS